MATHGPSPRATASRVVASSSCATSASRPRYAASDDPRPGRALAADRLVNRVLLLDVRRNGGEIAGEQLPADPRGVRDRQQCEHAGVADQLEHPAAERIPRLVIPNPHGHAAGEEEPVQLELPRYRRDAKSGKRALHRCRARRIAGIHQQRGRVEQLVSRARGVGRRRRRAYGRRDLGQPCVAREASRVEWRR